jgi:hypothetical protein
MNRTVTVQGIVGNVLTTCGVKWAAVNKIVEDGNATEFTVESVDYDADTITLVDATGFTGDMVLQKPYFFVGTPMATNAEWKKFSANEFAKVPFIWMVEPTRERFNYTDEPIERESEIRIVFLDSNNIKDWITTQTHDFKLQSLYNMYEEFVKAIKANVLFDEDRLTEINVRNLTKFGTETSSGFDSNIIDANLTGLDAQITLPININSECNC